MIDINNKIDCCGCAACVQKCPVKCIELHQDSQGFVYPKANKQLCINCGLCEKVCPVLNQSEPRYPKFTLAATNCDKEILLTSSSGGVFTLLARAVITAGGVVFGAKFDNNFNVVHSAAETIDEINEFQGSKYVQSIIGSCYSEAENYLKQGRKVMFSGTSCQIAGLKKFLRKNWEKQLLCVEVVCHGVPSPLIWREYLTRIMKEAIKPLKNTDLPLRTDGRPIANNRISFRDKRVGWEKYGLALLSSDLTTPVNSASPSLKPFFEPKERNLYLSGFLRDLYLRPSCFSCPAKKGKSGADIALADFWGIDKVLPAAYNELGVSLVMVYNAAILPWLAETFETNKTVIHNAEYTAALKYNPAIEHSAVKKVGAKVFWPLHGILKLKAIPIAITVDRIFSALLKLTHHGKR